MMEVRKGRRNMRWCVTKELMVTPWDVMMYCVHWECGYLKNTQYCYCQPFTFLTHFSQFTLGYSQWITNISPLFPAKYFPMLMICWCLDDTELWTQGDWWLWGSECPQWVVSVLDKYRVSLSLSHHPNIIITGWYRDSRSHQTMQTEHIFSVKLFCLFVWMFCTRVIGMQGTLCLCSRRSFI